MIEKAVILSTGDELTSGLTVDTNSNFLADKLFEIGVDLVAVIIVGDDAERIRWAFSERARSRRPGDRYRRPRPDRGRSDDRDGRRGARPQGVLRRGIRRAHPRALPLDRPHDAGEQSASGELSRRAPSILANPLGTAPGYRVEVDWHGQTTLHRRHARRAARDEADDGERRCCRGSAASTRAGWSIAAEASRRSVRANRRWTR